ncbi:MAG: molybdopterin-dependent oxidoreductase [Coriobacteriia bacterium]|nr:molybdopterin-dependent oxidoreductase [Coriobacteriia bacterium]
MQELALTRRSFVKTTALTGAALALGTKVSGAFSKEDKAWADTPSERKMYASACHGCICCCPVRVYVEDGIAVKIEGHPLAPISQGSLCIKGLSQLQTCYSPLRVLYPLKRSGDRGAENVAWERISWDDALDLASTKIAEAIEKYGTYSVISACGGGGGYTTGIVQTISMYLGSPNTFEPGGIQCGAPRRETAALMYYGQSQELAQSEVLECYKGLAPHEAAKGVTQDTKVFVVWGAQPSVSQTSQSGRGMGDLRAAGCKIIVVDPNMSPDAVKADIWLRVRPASDTALILSWQKYVIEKDLVDKEFCKAWTNMPFIINPDNHLPYYATEIFPDFVQSTPENTPAYVCWDNKSKSLQPLEFATKDVDPEIFWSGTVNGKQCRTAGQIIKEAAAPWTFEKAAETCWIPADLIEKAVKIYGEAPVAGIAHGVFSDQQRYSSQVALGLLGLDMMMGYVNKPGATLTQGGAESADPPKRPTNSPVNRGSSTSKWEIGFVVGMSEAQNAARIAALPEGMADKSQGTLYLINKMMRDRLGNERYRGIGGWSFCHDPSVFEAMRSGYPYRPRVLYEVSGNKLAMESNAEEVYESLMHLDFVVSQYPNLTSEQVEVADLVLPTQEWLELASVSRGQANYTFPHTPIIHLGETVNNNVVPQKVVRATSKKLNAFLDAGNEIVFGAEGAVTGKGPATPLERNTLSGVELMTDKNATAIYENDTSKYQLHFPIGNERFSRSLEEDSTARNSLADRFGAPDFETFINDVSYQQPDPNDPSDPTFVVDPKKYWTYGQHLREATDGLPKGFGTESRKCEVYCSIFVKNAINGFPYCYPEVLGKSDVVFGQEFKDQDPTYPFVGTYSPICWHIEPAESPIEGAPGYDPEYPLVLTSGRVYYFHHGTMRHAPFVRELCPAPDVRMHPKTAEKYGLKHMDWVEVTSRRGSTKGRVYETSSMHEKVIWMERHWNPECFDSSQPNKTGGWRECNVNMLTKGSPPYNEFYGSMTNRGFTVNVKKTTKPPNVWVEPKEFEPFMPYNANQYVPSAGSALDMEQTPIVEFNDWDRG